MRYAITGATGFVGGALARQLRGAGHEVRALVRDPSRADALTGLGVELVPGDLADTAALDRLCADVDGLFHVAGWYKLGQRDPSVGDRVNVEGTRTVLAAAQRAGVPKVVYTSTLGGELRHARRGPRRDLPAHRRLHQPLRPHQGGGAPGRRAVRRRRAAGRDRLARCRLRPRRHRPDRRPARPGRGRQAPAGAGRRRGLLGARRRRRGRARAGHGARRARGDLHARRAPHDAGRGAAPGRDDRRHQGSGGAARPRWSGRRRRSRARWAASYRCRRTSRRRRCAPPWRRTSARPRRPSASSAGSARSLDTGLRQTAGALRG